MAATNLIEKLTAIGDAVREKTETTDALTLDAMAEAIAALETGGGSQIYTETFTFAIDDLAYQVFPGFGKCPNIMAYQCVDGFDVTYTSNPIKYSASMFVTGDGEADNITGGYRWKSASSTSLPSNSGLYAKKEISQNYPAKYDSSSDKVTFTAYSSTSSTTAYYFQAGATYVFVCGVI